MIDLVKEMDSMKINNRLFDNLQTGKTSLGCVVTMSDLVVSELAGDCGMDFCWIDAEHAPHISRCAGLAAQGSCA